MEYSYHTKLSRFREGNGNHFKQNKNLNNAKGKEKISNMIKVATLTRKVLLQEIFLR